MKDFIKSKISILSKHPLTIVGVFIGAIAGYLYYHFIGCSSGSCAITSKPLNSTIYGALMGGLFFSMFQKDNNKNINHENRTH
jgi:LytS/YehU family sensor histidine kinase